ncbi:hypothetical protein B0H13DRAFT_2072529 [Mycena leptocephala]|nr:hypothetical protein B0H13DRAFT_2072529 [Mycena leptocephala]
MVVVSYSLSLSLRRFLAIFLQIAIHVHVSAIHTSESLTLLACLTPPPDSCTFESRTRVDDHFAGRHPLTSFHGSPRSMERMDARAMYVPEP